MQPDDKPPSHQNIVILDYDDTLLPTTFLNPEDEQQMEDLVQTHKDELQKIED